MRRLLLIGGASALIALPAGALAQTDEPVPETDPAAEEAVGTTTDKALHSEGTGGFRYEGSGGVAITADGGREGARPSRPGRTSPRRHRLRRPPRPPRTGSGPATRARAP